MAAGLLSRVCLHPLDTIKCRVQYLRGRPGPVAVLKYALRENVYRGIAPALVGVLPFSAVYMPSYELATRFLGRGPAAGAFAGLCGSVVKCPIDTVKKRLQSSVYKNAAAAVASIGAEASGRSPLARLRPFYGGWGITGLYDVLYNCLQFTILEAVRTASRAASRAADASRRRRGLVRGGEAAAAGRPATGRRNVVIGAVTGALTSLATEPMDVVRTRLLTQRRAGLQAAGASYYRNWAHCARTILREEGAGALFKGSLPRLATVSLSSSLWLGVYAVIKDRLVAREARERQLRATEEEETDDKLK